MVEQCNDGAAGWRDFLSSCKNRLFSGSARNILTQLWLGKIKVKLNSCENLSLRLLTWRENTGRIECMLKLFRYLKAYWWQIVILCVAIFVQSWSVIQLPAIMAEIVNNGIVAGDISYVWEAGARMVLFALIASACAVVANMIAAIVGTGFARDLRNDVFKKVLSFSVGDMKNFSTASLITRTTNDVMQVQQAAVMCMTMLLRAPVMAIMAIVQAVVTAPDMTWIIALAVAVLLVLVVTILGIVMPKFKIFQQLVDKITMLTRENLTGLRVIRAFNNEKLEQKKFDKANTDLTKLAIWVDKVMSLQNPLINLVFNGTTILCIWIGVSLITKDVAYLGNMMAFMQYAIQVIMSFLFLTMLFIVLPRANVSAKRINEIMNTKTLIGWKDHTVGKPDLQPSVEFDHVSFAYESAEAKVLEDVSFVAKAGETTAFIGSTGSGKSTLINLVPRFYEATTGTIKINGIDIKDYAQDDLMRRIGYVPQKGILFAGTVKSNIMFGAPEISDEEVRRAAQIAQAEEFIEKLDKKYEAHIAQGGSNVSGGQKQRLSIARAVAKDPDIYIFDDSFSALDMKTDAKLRQALKPVTKNAVTLIVAQRISTIKDAEQIVVLNEGKVAGKGTHHELLQSCPVYREIAKSQLSEDEFAAELERGKLKKEKIVRGGVVSKSGGVLSGQVDSGSAQGRSEQIDDGSAQERSERGTGDLAQSRSEQRTKQKKGEKRA